MTKKEALKLLCDSDHAFISEEGVKKIADAFGVKVTTYIAHANPQDFKGLSLFDKNGKPIDKAKGQDAHKVAMQICDGFDIKYEDFFGIGSQLRECCEKLQEYLDGVKWEICFFCEKEKVKFTNGKGLVALGERKDGSEFGTHPHCGCLTKKAPSPENA